MKQRSAGALKPPMRGSLQSTASGHRLLVIDEHTRIQRLDSFAGAYYHTGNWPYEGVDFTAKRVGVIGTGSSAIQAIPVIAKESEHLFVFQRTANYSIPAHNGSQDPELVKQSKRTTWASDGASGRCLSVTICATTKQTP